MIYIRRLAVKVNIIYHLAHPTANLRGREQCPATPTDGINLVETRSKIGHHRVLKTLLEAILRGFFIWVAPHLHHVGLLHLHCGNVDKNGW